MWVRLNILKKASVFIVLFIAIFSASTSVLFATDYSSSSFIVRDPVISTDGGYSSSSSFKLFSSGGQNAIGIGESTNFISRSGFLYFPKPANFLKSTN